MLGRTVSHYRILEKLGQGGMGEVYRAHDTKLGRDVAVKVLPGSLADDPERVARFKREARTLASLHHPHIASIFDLEEIDQERLLVMEYVEGEDLSQRLQRGPLPIDEALDIARQIAEGLEAAHEKGIVHRDLKPANVKVTPGGKVKILDFGLARAYRADRDDGEGLDENSPTITAALTRAGTILGTAAYMSPEQARAKHVDKRTDIWAFACVLYEILTGRRCFTGTSVTDVLAAVVQGNPDWSLLPPGLPWRVRDLLQQALQKDPRRRIRDMGDVALALELADADERSGSLLPGSDAAAPGGTAWSRRLIWLAAGLVLGAATLAFLTRPWSSDPGLENPLAGATLMRLTDFPGDELKAALSPDGRFVAFASDRRGDFDLVVGQIGSRDFRDVTQDHSVVLHPQVRSWGFTRDGSGIWMSGMTGRIRTTSLLGGPFHDFLGEEAYSVDWSPDGSRLVYRNATGGDPLFVADREGSNSRMILDAPDGYHQHFPTWSADGEWIYLVRGWPTEAHLWRLRPDGSELEQLTNDLRGVGSPAPIDARSVLFCAQDREGGGPWLWMFDAETKQTRRISFGMEQYTSIASSKDGRRVVATVADPQAMLWRVPILDRVAGEADAVPHPMPTVRARYPRYGRNALFYLSSMGSGDGLWRYQDGEATEIWRGSDITVLEEGPEVSPASDLVALVVREEDRRRILLLSTNGRERRELPSGHVDLYGGVAWSPDGRWIAAGGIEAGTKGLFKFPVDGGPPTRIVEGQAARPVWSPRGDMIVFAGAQIGAEAPLLAVRADGTPVELPEIKVLFQQGGMRARFTPDGRALIYMHGGARLQDFHLLDLASMQIRRLTKLEDPAEMTTFDVAPDGSEIVFDRMRGNSDVVLIELAIGALK